MDSDRRRPVDDRACRLGRLDLGDNGENGHPPSAPALSIEVRGHQWWWEFAYFNDDPSKTFVTANEIHIPVGKPVRFVLKGEDVIHTFWVPSLGGKFSSFPARQT